MEKITTNYRALKMCYDNGDVVANILLNVNNDIPIDITSILFKIIKEEFEEIPTHIIKQDKPQTPFFLDRNGKYKFLVCFIATNKHPEGREFIIQETKIYTNE